ncbi:MAG: FaeA/PapI family transcriptional regulator [Candidatus Buchananbacteria bacterium]|jgi:predicted HTH transcriptional regulator
MTYIIIALLLIFLLLAYLKIRSLSKEVEILKKEKEEEAKIGQGLSGYNERRDALKQEKKGKILSLFASGKSISNDTVADALGISSVTAFRYLDELEKEGKLAQKGLIGKKVYYIKIS